MRKSTIVGVVALIMAISPAAVGQNPPNQQCIARCNANSATPQEATACKAVCDKPNPFIGSWTVQKTVTAEYENGQPYKDIAPPTPQGPITWRINFQNGQWTIEDSQGQLSLGDIQYNDQDLSFTVTDSSHCSPAFTFSGATSTGFVCQYYLKSLDLGHISGKEREGSNDLANSNALTIDYRVDMSKVSLPSIR